jgi:hypothetical protein
LFIRDNNGHHYGNILIYFCLNRGDDSFPIVNFPFFSSNIVIVPHTVYGVYVFDQLIAIRRDT